MCVVEWSWGSLKGGLVPLRESPGLSGAVGGWEGLVMSQAGEFKIG